MHALAHLLYDAGEPVRNGKVDRALGKRNLLNDDRMRLAGCVWEGGAGDRRGGKLAFG
jgi:hypothetical protein